MTEDHGTARTDQTPSVPQNVPVDFRPPAEPASLVHALIELSRSIPGHVAYTFLEDGDSQEINITYRELDWRAQAIAARLQRYLKPGDRAALVYEPSLEYIAALAGCFYAGIIAVPVYPPDPMRIQRTVTRLQAILNDAQTDVILTRQDEYDRFGSLLKFGRVINTEEITEDEGIDFARQAITPETLALLQYTSGSTGTPKGVMLTHANLMFNFEHIKRFDEPDAVAVSWLPMYHDMGLIGLVLQALQSGRRTVLMSPLSFVKRPFHWLQAISRYRAYATSGPSFAYELCVQKISEEEKAQLDLSCWTLACNGAEPIRIDTMRRFSEKFASCGFRPEVFYPCYGLAEATLIVSGGDKFANPIIKSFDAKALDRHKAIEADESGDVVRREIVGCGTSVAGQRIAVVDPETCLERANGEIGEVWVQGPGVAQGYWNNPESTSYTFDARLRDSDDGPFLRTGDLGFMQADELFITGRIKDLIIIRGRNHYPQDIERTVEDCHRSLRRDHGAAFSIQHEGEERLVVVQGVVRPQKLDLDQLFSDIKSALVQEHELAPLAIVLVKCGEIPRTSSGKIQRRACREMFEKSELKVVAQWNGGEASRQERNLDTPNREDLTYANCVHCRSILGVVSQIVRELKNGSAPPVIHRNSMIFGDLNLESIDLVMLNELIERHYQRTFPFSTFMAELGRQNQRDISMGQFVEFIHEHVGTSSSG